MKCLYKPADYYLNALDKSDAAPDMQKIEMLFKK